MVVWLKGAGSKSSGEHQSGDGETEGGRALGPGGGKVVLRETCGTLPAGGFCAILGPSGAGKSTLVDVLAGKRKAGKVEGKVGFVRRHENSGRVKIGYVDQVSCVFILLTGIVC
jgi:ABC-type multidrug transport system ATPase subunit